jgi:metal-responsive CopG/Arc/MetJ family transcriptional regulator
MAGAAKIAVSLDAELLRRVETFRHRTGESRSALVSRALRLLTAEGRRAELIDEYQRTYRTHPELAGEVALARRLAKRSAAALDWDD